MKKTSKGLALMHKYAKAQVTPEKKIEWFRNRHIEHLGEIRLLKSRLKLALKKVAYLENKLQTKNNMKPTYQDLNLRMNEIFGTKKTRARATGGGTYCYYATAVNGNSESAPSPMVTASVPTLFAPSTVIIVIQ